MPAVRKAIAFSVASKYSLSVLGLITSMVIARLLTPAEIGLFAVASSLLMILSEVRLLGAGVFLVREAELTETKIRAALGLTILISWGLGLAIIILAPIMADFYGIPEIRLIFWILSASFITAPFISVPAALLTRALRFETLFLIRLATSLTALVASIGLVLMGLSYYGLALATTLSMLVQLLVTIRYAPQTMCWRPAFNGLKPVIAVGIFSSAANLLKKAPTTLPDLIIGKTGTTTQVGLYSRGLGFIDFLFQSMVMGVSPVALPYLSQVKRESGSVPLAYTRACVLLTGLVWPVLAVASIVSLPMIRLFFGGQWDAAAPLASILAFWAIARAGHAFFQQAMVSVKHEKAMLVKELLTCSIYVVGLLMTASLGLHTIALIMLAAAAADFVLSSWVLKRYVGVSVSAFMSAMVPSAGLTVLCWLCAWILYQAGLHLFDAPLLGLLMVSLALPFVWLIGLWALKHPLAGEVFNALNHLNCKIIR